MSAKETKTAKFVRLAATLEWACLTKTNKMSNKYEVDLTRLEPSAVAALKKLGLKPKLNPEKPERGYTIKCKSSRPINCVVDTDGEAVDGSLVGNGTKAIVTVGTYAWKFQGKEGFSASAKKIVVTDLQVYDGGEPSDDEVVDVTDEEM